MRISDLRGSGMKSDSLCESSYDLGKYGGRGSTSRLIRTDG